MFGRITNTPMRTHFFVNDETIIFKKKPLSNRFKKFRTIAEKVLITFLVKHTAVRFSDEFNP